ncbi:MAG: metal ABC transporter permease [Ruminococcus sp.]|nr:metal ABC transporter permease [Ruminococcus sp.]
MADSLGSLRDAFINYPFVRYAMIVGLLIALCSSLLGVPLVLKRFSFIGDGLSHVAFGAIAVGSAVTFALRSIGSSGADGLAEVLSVNHSTAIVLPITVISAILLLRTGQNTKIKGDAAVAMISVGSLAVGYLIMNRFPTSSNISGDVCSTLFGSYSILTLKLSDVILCSVMAAAVIVTFILFYNKIFAVTFDETFTRASGVNAGAYNLMTAVITAVVIVLAMNLVGSLLISALIIFPALSAMRIFRSFRSVMICSAVISVICAAFGIILSILYSTPTGSTIVAADIAVFLLMSLVSAVTRRN